MLFDDNGIFTDVTERGNNDEMYHYGTPRHSGRYPWGAETIHINATKTF